MVRAELDGWARDFAADHGCDDVTVPFHRVVLRHLPRIEAFLARGLTFTVLAHAIIAAHFVGARYRQGEACSDRRSIWSRQEATAGGRSVGAGLADMPAAVARGR